MPIGLGALLAVMMLALGGCAGGSSAKGPAVDSNRLRMMAGFYEGYLGNHRNQPPPNEHAFRDYLTSKQESLQKAGLTVGDMFVSPRNGMPIQWVYGRRLPFVRQKDMTCYGYEKEPVDGKRLVVGGRGMFEELDETQFRSVFPNTP
jgi:hypothetical protein